MLILSFHDALAAVWEYVQKCLYLARKHHSDVAAYQDSTAFLRIG